jgi:hypothetical protein
LDKVQHGLRPAKAVTRVVGLHFALVVTAMAARPSGVAAQAIDPALVASRREAIRDALAASDAGDHVRSLDLALRAERIAASPSLRAIIAREAEYLGSWVLALGEASQCEAEAVRNVAIPDREHVIEECRRLIARAEREVGQLRLRLPMPRPDGLHVSIGGAVIPPVAWGLPYVVIPGAIAVEVSADGYETYRSSIEVAAGQTVERRAELAPAATASIATPVIPVIPVIPVTPVTPVMRVSPVTPHPVAPPPTAGIGPWIVGGAGLASLGIAGLFYGLSRAAYPSCADSALGCPGSQEESYDSYARYSVSAQITLGTGAAALATAVVWWAVGRRGRPASAPHAMLQMTPTSDGASLGVAGLF